MTLAFGKASSVAARVHKGQKVFEVKVVSAKRDVAMLALKRAASKLSGTYKIRFSQSAS
jgi:ribosomal protein L16/L10AE